MKYQKIPNDEYILHIASQFEEIRGEQKKLRQYLLGSVVFLIFFNSIILWAVT